MHVLVDRGVHAVGRIARHPATIAVGVELIGKTLFHMPKLAKPSPRDCDEPGATRGSGITTLLLKASVAQVHECPGAPTACAYQVSGATNSERQEDQERKTANTNSSCILKHSRGTATGIGICHQEVHMTVPDEAQDVLSKVAVLTPKDAERLMQSAASRLGNARDGFQLAKKARQNLHKNW